MNINVRLAKNFTTQYNKMIESFGEEFARLNGFSDEQLSYTDFINNFVDAETVADASVDGNANVGSKDMRTLMNEMPKAHRKLLAYNKIYYELNKKYGFKTANEWLAKEWTKALYMHDADTSTFVHYCFAYDLKDLAERGLYFLNNFNAEPPKHLSTFVDFVKEFISFASNRSSGAVGLPNLIPYMYYFWKNDCANGYATKSDDYYARQQIQRFIYAVNQPYVRDGMQSAFTNVSVYDGPYLEALFGGSKFPDGTYMVDYLDEIKEFQKLFMEVVSDIRSHNMFTFPVLTISLLRQNGKFKDEEFAKWGIKHNYKRYKLPVIITENGMSAHDWVSLDGKVHDPNRIDFLTRYLRGLKCAVEEGCEVAGYFHWSFMDNFEWACGYNPRFGLIHVDYTTQKRTPKDSAYWYKTVIQSNGENL